MEILSAKNISQSFDTTAINLENSLCLPSISINGYILRKSSSAMALNLNAICLKDFSLILRDLYKELTSLQLALLFSQANNNGFLNTLNAKAVDFLKSTLEAYKFNFSTGLLEIASLLDKLPKKFINWCLDKKIQLSDLDVLLCIEFNPYLEFIAEKNFSHSQGLQFLELTTDLILSKLELNISDFEHKKNEDIILHLKKLRYPNTYKFADKKHFELQSIAPDLIKNINIQALSDNLNINLSYNIKSIQDIKKLEINLEKIKAVYKNDAN